MHRGREEQFNEIPKLIERRKRKKDKKKKNRDTCDTHFSLAILFIAFHKLEIEQVVLRIREKSLQQISFQLIIT